MSGSKIIKVSLLFVCLIMLVLAGCSAQTSTTAAPSQTPTTAALSSPPITTSTAPTATAPTSPSPVTRLYTDDLGNKVTLPDNPSRVLALTKNMMDEIYTLGITPVGKVEEYTNVAALVALPSVSNQSTPNMEAVYQLKPDLILANSRQHASMLDGLKSSGATVVMIDPNKLSKSPLTDEVVVLGTILNRNSQAQAYMEKLNTVITGLQAKLLPAGYKTGLFMMSGDAISVAQPTGVYGALLPALGIKNIVPEGLPGSDKSTWVAYDAETILKADPDIIMIKSSSNDAQANQKILDTFMQNVSWKDLKAVKNSKVFVIPSKIAPGSLSTEDILKQTAKIIYPAGF
jgi:iron complex transport system substrate-binding protein